MKSIWIVAGLALVGTALLQGQEPTPRPAWDHDKAVDIITKVMAIEESGQPWDKIAWRTNVDEAIAESRKDDKPLFVYAFVRGTRGPAAAPC